MIVSLALALLSVGSPRVTAAVLAPEIGGAASVRSAPAIAVTPAAAFSPAALPFLPAALAAAPLAAAPAPVAVAPVPVVAAPALAPAAAEPSAARSLTAASLPEPMSAAIAFDGGAAAPIPRWDLAVGPIEARPPARLQLLSASDLGVGGDEEPEAPRPPSGDPKPFLYRHHRLVRAVVLPFLRLLYDIRVDGALNLPDGPVLVVPNHVSFLDPILITFAANRPIRFLMYRPLYETWGLQWLFRSLGAIPISPKDPKDVIEESLNRARRALAAGESVGIFPEGTVTRDGSFSPFRRGFERVALGLGVPVVPARIDGMWGSVLSRHPLKGWKRSLLARLRGRRRVGVRFGAPLERADASLAREAVERLAAPR